MKSEYPCIRYRADWDVCLDVSTVKQEKDGTFTCRPCDDVIREGKCPAHFKVSMKVKR